MAKQEPEEREELAEVGFPREIPFSKLEELFGFMAKGLDAELRYNTESETKIEGNEKTTEIRRVGGNIFRFKKINFLAFLPFDIISDFDNDGNRIYKGIRFSFTPGYDVSELSAEEVEARRRAIGCVRKYFEEYFSEVPGEKR